MYKKSPEWKQFDGLDNVCFLPHRNYLKSWGRERVVVQYTLARMIARGDLSEERKLNDFAKGKVLVLCNLRPRVNGKTNVRPDIIALSASGNVLIIECKILSKRDGDDLRAARKLGKAAHQLSEYAGRFKRFSKSSLKDPYESWSRVYHTVYTRHGFPPFDEIIRKSLGLRTANQQRSWIQNITARIAEGQVFYGLAANGPPDGHIPEKQVLMGSYSALWGRRLGSILLFMVDHAKDSFVILELRKSGSLGLSGRNKVTVPNLCQK